MLDIGWSEMAMVALLLLLVIGPKDLPRVMRTVGQWVRKARGFARDFQSSLDDMIEDDELREAKRSIEQETRKFNKRDAFGIGDNLEKHVDPTGSLRSEVRDVEAQVQSTEVPAAAAAGTTGAAVTSGAPAGENGEAGTVGGDGTGAASGGGAQFVEHETPMAPGNSVQAGRTSSGGNGAATSTDGAASEEGGSGTSPNSGSDRKT